jgi:hypothetical protein
MKGVQSLILCFCLVSLGFYARASDVEICGKSQPLLQGSITDAATKKPVAGVVVSIFGQKSSEKKEYTTDATGNFIVPQFASGEVTIVLEKKGYKTFRREGVVLKEGNPIKLNMDLKTEARSEDGIFFNPLMLMLENDD